VRRVPVVVDTCFWRPCNDTAPELNTVLAVGRERRDYATLTSAARAMPEVRLEIVAGSPWARGRRDAFPDVPSNVVVTPGGLTPAELRERYQRAAAVALPLEGGCLYAAGVNALLEAAAVGCPVVATQTPGLAEYTDGRPDVRTVAPGDAPALAAALWAALDGPRPVPQPVPMLDGYVNALTAIVREVAG
jgi:glycosyltransferase involved in cell wall biosynthesis